MKCFYIITFLLIISCTKESCPVPFSNENEPNISKIYEYHNNELRLTYYIDGENRIDEIHVFDVSYDNIVEYDYKHDYTYNSCGSIKRIEELPLNPDQEWGYTPFEFIYDEYGDLAKIIIPGESPSSMVLQLITHIDSNNSVNFKEYRSYNPNTGEYSILNHNYDLFFDESDNLINAFNTDYSYAGYNFLTVGDWFEHGDEITYHSFRNPFFLIQNRTYGRKNLFIKNHYNLGNSILGFITLGVSKDLVNEFSKNSNIYEITVNSFNEGYATSFTIPDPNVEIKFEVLFD